MSDPEILPEFGGPSPHRIFMESASTYRKRHCGHLLALTDDVKHGPMPMLTLPEHPLCKIEGLVLGGCEVGKVVSVAVSDELARIRDVEVVPGHRTPPLWTHSEMMLPCRASTLTRIRFAGTSVGAFLFRQLAKLHLWTG